MRRTNKPKLKCDCESSSVELIEVEVTYAEVQTLIGNSELIIGNIYKITDNTNAESGEIVLTPISVNSFNSEGTYIPQFDNSKKWFCIYDYPSNTILEIRDDKGNIAIGSIAVNNMEWSDTLIVDNLFSDMAGLDLSGNTGTIERNTFEKDSVLLAANNSGSISTNTMSNYANISLVEFAGIMELNTVNGSGIDIVSSNPDTLLSGNNLFSGSMSFNGDELDLRGNNLNLSQFIVPNFPSGKLTVYDNNFFKSVVFAVSMGVGQNNIFSENNMNFTQMQIISPDVIEINRNIFKSESLIQIQSANKINSNRFDISTNPITISGGDASGEIVRNVFEKSNVNITGNTGVISNNVVSGNSSFSAINNAGTVDRIHLLAGATVEVAANVGITHEKGVHAFSAGYVYPPASNATDTNDGL